MKIKWLGHASFLITAEDGTKIITDPYGKYDGLNYAPINESADVVLISHQHGDHTGGNVGGNPQEISSTGSSVAKGIEVKGVASYHDQSNGKERGENIIFCFAVDGIRICHLGDLGHVLSNQQVADIGQVDVLLVPVGGLNALKAAQSAEVVSLIEPYIVIPMHYKIPHITLKLDPVSKFLTEMGITKTETVESLKLTKSSLPDETQVVVMDPRV